MKKPVVLGFYGKSNSGKTSLIVKIIQLLTKEGNKVATVKISEKEICIDSKGKDTYLHSAAGSNLSVLSSKFKTDYLLKQRNNLEKIIEDITLLGEYDIILVEGANDKSTKKIRIGDINIRDNTILTYNENFDELVKIIKNEMLRGNNMKKIDLKVNGKKIPISEFPEEIIKNTICGMIESLKGVDEIKKVEISFEM